MNTTTREQKLLDEIVFVNTFQGDYYQEIVVVANNTQRCNDICIIACQVMNPVTSELVTVQYRIEAPETSFHNIARYELDSAYRTYCHACLERLDADSYCERYHN